MVRSREFAVVAAMLLVVAVVAGCVSGPALGSPIPPRTPGSASPSVVPSATPAPSAVPPASGSAGPPRAVRLALDWTPNTNHTGFFVARAKGWYREAGIDLQVLPYTGTTPETLLAAGQADCGISFQDSLTFAVVAGAPIVSVMAILQHAGSDIAVLESGPIKRPRDLDGTTYGGFGYPNEVPTVKAVIVADGGKGDFRVATLNATAYEALYNGDVDSTITFRAWEGIEAAQRGIGLRYFKFTDYGFPDFYQVLLACNADWLAASPDVAKRFVGATVRGFGFAAANPEDGAIALIAENPGVFDANASLPLESARYLAENKLLVDAEGKVGRQTLKQWQGYSGFLYEQGLLIDASGKPLAAAPDYASLFTNDYVP